ncbi:MAG: hypothetical protein A3C80_03405 [Candidatus Ryanbacteria bacterium RIFCSPHIGHO2_02_FULL_45_43]|uniref:LemA family protein n=1 Tax=Candidatus Ryanbacteria bacterium RIFCSPHIGHO2_01_45_13 TaxID=1802112 RepID=A0A1G2FUS1_9BACT|nr:MAG: hypothetical protein A2W41_01350 [Candidatus Ryanbacteria bacterium RIFCSPHIGHO2_01_45_13]OGZ41509.1 MAG: hypothetical protein A2718_03670 [Candidatus Ryanbacteria bacterium RIFCSPHIGHO2_01_FULL_44_130]OGZ47976.1 MAG: hypothetical protein A3C80_03405 [Candidatus Ryanbacteria bacterium RIFCSPHIGHO2_02_FULL_45_43]OGZ50112.1 MAG: hypothetical protein A3E55_01270 [Candidatus Ryanbacteria bacterium RIFCSPHIGHO2_12_FULL_44_20]OGZ51114.1 MAG: hypothetical protein A3A17_03710 [Candidatus Ryanba
MTVFYIAIAVVVVLILWVVLSYNTFIRLRNRVEEGWSDIEVQLKRRFNLIPNLVETVKGYMTHEREVFEKVTAARAQTAAAKTGTDRAEAENMLSNTLKTLFAVAENYPDLKANANFLDLQRELADTENKIQSARRFYNTVVKELNNKVGFFPSNIVARLFKFHRAEFFQTEEEIEREPVKVEF